MENLLNNPLFGILLSIGALEVGKKIYGKTKQPIFNPLLLAIIMIILLLIGFDIPLESYNKGGNIILFFLGPATVVLAVPLYKQVDLLKSHFLPIIVGVMVGAVTAMVSVIIMGKLFNLNGDLLLSLVPKSITTPIGIEVSKSLGGNPSITIMGILISGITGYIVAPSVCKVFKIENKVAKGIGIGAASHAIGTSKALEIDEVVGAMSGLAIGLTGLATLVLAPLVVKIFF